MKKITERIKQFIKGVLGITKLENKINQLQNKNHSIVDRLETHSRWIEGLNLDNQLILRHIKLINSSFLVVSDINNPKYDPSIVLILHRGKEEIVKSYYFNNSTVEEIHRMLEGFGKDNNRIDQPIGYRQPRWRY